MSNTLFLKNGTAYPFKKICEYDDSGDIAD
jgi:hypothetical protein